MDGLWNANIHYDRRLAACVPDAAGAVLDVGCGDGFLAARLARRVPFVVAIDSDAPVLGRARARFPEAPVTLPLLIQHTMRSTRRLPGHARHSVAPKTARLLSL